MNKRKLIKVNYLLTDTFICVFGGQKSNLNIINNNINKDYEITNRNISNFIKHILIDILSVFVIFFSINWLVYSPNGYIAWIILAIKVSVIGLGVCILLNLIFYRKEMIHLLMYVKKRKKSA